MDLKKAGVEKIRCRFENEFFLKFFLRTAAQATVAQSKQITRQ